MANFCDKCGERVNDDDLFCNNCGSKLNRSKTWIEPGSAPKAPIPPRVSDQQETTYTKPSRFYRSRQNKWVAGVCGGAAEHFDMDPDLVRVGFFIALFVTGGMALFIYIVLALFIEENPNQESLPPRQSNY